MTPRDAFWAAKLIMSFNREELAAIVETGEFSDPDNAAYFLEVLIERQRKCGEFGLNGVNPIDGFTVAGDKLEFTNLSDKYGFVEGTTEYRIKWSVFNNDKGSIEPLRGPLVQSATSSELPESDYYRRHEHLFLLAEIHTLNDKYPHWNKPVSVYLRPKG